VPASCLFLEILGFGGVEQADQAEADEQVEIGGGQVHAAPHLRRAAYTLV
jgi:hypothetical protein